MNLTAQISNPPEFLQLLSNDIRWRLLQALAVTDMHVQELVEVVSKPQNLVSYHLKKLQAHGILQEHRSIADGREVYYSLDLNRVRASYMSAGESLHPALGGEIRPEEREGDGAPDNTIRVLFLCTHNSARSQIAEAILRTRSKGKIDVHSAGTEATDIHPLAIQALSDMNIDIGGQYSKSLERYVGQVFDYIITVCDRAKESCPVFPGDPVRIHWSFPDPSAVDGSDARRYAAFNKTTVQMMTRISYLILMIQRQYGLRLD
jgi:ArsR family transcriptional regulator, arsenate/arsenite/antimonite-responsive transcriptional repressor / arsenate reductase (thioredoxin)